MTFRLYTAPLSMFGMKAEIALREKGIAPDIVMVAFDNARGYQPKHPEVLRINPKGQVPVLIHDGAEIYDSTQIFEYLEDLALDPALWPADHAARAKARQLEHASDEVFFPHIIRLMGLQDALQGEAASVARLMAQSYYERTDARLVNQDWLAGSYSYADIAFFMALVFGERLGAPLTEATLKLTAWRDRMVTRPAITPVMTRLVEYLRANNRFVPAFLSGV